MIRRQRPTLPTITILAVLGLGFGLAGCATTNESAEPPPPPVAQTLPPSFPPQNLVGSYGLAAYHKEEDRPRTESAAANQCRQPYIITMGPTGGVMMHLADQPTPTELRVKGAAGGKNFIGPAEDPPGGTLDREVVSFDGRVLILRFMDPEVHGRYGSMVYVRCPAEGVKKPRAKVAAKPAAKPAARPAAARPAAARPAPASVQPPIQRQ
jgi:hypothetical protein